MGVRGAHWELTHVKISQIGMTGEGNFWLVLVESLERQSHPGAVGEVGPGLGPALLHSQTVSAFWRLLPLVAGVHFVPRTLPPLAVLPREGLFQEVYLRWSESQSLMAMALTKPGLYHSSFLLRSCCSGQACILHPSSICLPIGSPGKDFPTVKV